MRPTALCSALLLTFASSASASERADFKRLHPDGARASSYLQNDWNKFTENYHPNYALDDDPKTAWVEGAEGDGQKETLVLAVSPIASARAVRLDLRSGYHKSKALFVANGAPKGIRVSLLTDGGEVVVSGDFTLERKQDWQQVELKVPPKKGFSQVQLEVVSVFPGKKYKDTCISDARVWVDSDVPYNQKVEEVKRDALRAWIKERVAAAKYFKSLPAQYPFAGTHFQSVEDRNEHEGRFLEPDVDAPEERKGWMPVSTRLKRLELHAPLKKLFTEADRERVRQLLRIASVTGGSVGKHWSKVAVKRRLQLPDGLELFGDLQDVADLLDRTAFGLFEAAERTDASRPPRSLSTYMELVQAWTTSNLRVEYAAAPAVKAAVENAPLPVADARVRRAYFWMHTIVEERSAYEERRHFVIDYDEAQRPAFVSVLTEGSGHWGVQLFAFTHDAKGRIQEVVHKRASHSDGEEGGETYESNFYSYTRLTPVPSQG